MTVGDKVRQRREELGLTRKKLAEQARLDEQWICEVEESLRKPYVNCMPFFHLALALGVKPEDLA